MKRVLVYLSLAVAMTWPAALHPVAAVPGSARGDLWDGLWSFWFFAEKLRDGQAPVDVAGFLNAPHGGALWVADPLNSVVGLPLVWAVGPAAAWTVLCLVHLTFAGLVAHRLGEETGGDGWAAGVLYAFAPIGMAHLHNGATEMVGTGWLAWAALELHRGRWARAGVALGLCAVGNAYDGVDGFLLAVLLARRSPRALLAAALGVALAAPVAALAWRLSTTPGNVVGIKTARELMSVRRTIGPADPLAFFVPGDYRSPDFRELARYGEDYVHSPYLGWVALGAAAFGVRRKGSAPWVGAVVVAGLLALGPVLAQHGAPVLLPGRKGVPLPYLLVEKLPGFSALSLPWRLAQLSALGVAVLAARGAGRWGPAVAVLALFETRFVSPVAGLPAHADATPDPVLAALAAAPEGGVIEWPVAGGRAYLYEQTIHHHPIAGSLNFPQNTASKQVWAQLPDLTAARKAGLRYLLVHDDRPADPDPSDAVVARLAATSEPVARSDRMRLYALW